jgi:hypothetical protein
VVMRRIVGPSCEMTKVVRSWCHEVVCSDVMMSLQSVKSYFQD